jgi:hypothetical protein
MPSQDQGWEEIKGKNYAITLYRTTGNMRDKLQKEATMISQT